MITKRWRMIRGAKNQSKNFQEQISCMSEMVAKGNNKDVRIKEKADERSTLSYKVP